MIADCAIDPEVFAEWRHFQSLYEDFGVSEGRMISKFPKKSWMRTVADRSRELVQSGKNSEMQAVKIEERLRSDRFKRKLKNPGGRICDPLLSWEKAASSVEPPFDLIITSETPSCSHSIAADELMKDESPFLQPRQSDIRRTKDELCKVVERLLESSRELVLVDPNFRADEPRFSQVFLRILSQLENYGTTPTRVEVHTKRYRGDENVYNKSAQASQWWNNIAPNLPSGVSVKVIYWGDLPQGGKPHARFLMTELGGLYIDHGLDEGDGTTLVTLLDDSIWESLFKNFDSAQLPSSIDPDEHILEIS